MTRVLAVLTLLTLAACGADGDPFVPGAEPSVEVTGHVTMGVNLN